MYIKGLQKLTLLDFPGKMACTVFVGGCNFRCPFCHNASLVTRIDGSFIGEDEIFSFLQRRRGILEGVCISGGEPTLMPDLEDFIRRVRQLGYKVKLDTNGYRPDILSRLIDEGLLDYVAMDIKSSREGYSEATGIDGIDISKIEESVAKLGENKVPYEFRTTLVRELHSEDTVRKIGEWLRGDEQYFLQTFVDSSDLIKEGFTAFNKNETDNLLNVLKVYVPNAKIR